ncbi:Hypothetical protein A7982_01655 [Minicystis rosea]|nr:Hypothetical protein A7982_01655 [Minicystis rosea]
MNKKACCSALLLGSILLAGAGAPARADELKIDWGGKIQSDLRFRLQDQTVGHYYDQATLPAGVERNQNLLSIKLKASYGSFAGVANIDMYLNPVGAQMKTLKGFDDLQKYNATAPFTFEPQALYVEGKNLGIKGLDLRMGQQLVSWGVADQFNPTNNLNSDDLRDPLLFGKQVPNFMVKLDYWVTKSFSISGVLVPVFRPAMLPRSSALGAVDIQRMPFADPILRHRIESEFGYAASLGYPTVINKVTPVLPETSAENMQFAYRLAGTIGEQDIALSYYLGRTDFPQPFANHTFQKDKQQCDPNKPTNCNTGTLRTNALLGYPRMHVFGFNMSGEFNPFKKISESIHGIGYRIEAAVVVPKRSTIRLTQDTLTALFQGAGEYDYDGDDKPGGGDTTVIQPTPFLKWTLGLDYTFGSHVYVNAMWVHGLADEYGAGDWMHEGWVVRQSGVATPGNPNGPVVGPLIGSMCVNNRPKSGEKCATETLAPRLGDYLVLGADFKFLDDAGLFRLFTIWSLSGVTMESWQFNEGSTTEGKRVRTHYSLFTKEGFSASIYPEVDYNFGNGLELGAGALILLGKSYTKFGDPASGGSIAFTRARYSF